MPDTSNSDHSRVQSVAREVWVGPQPYSEAHYKRLFGREDEVADLLNRIETYRFSAIVAKSGVGKSSLVLAGLVPSLRIGRAGNPTTPLVLVLRDWVFSGYRNSYAVFGSAIVKAIKNLDGMCNERELRQLGLSESTELLPPYDPRTWTVLTRDIQELASIPAPGAEEWDHSNLIEYIQALSTRCGRLLFVVDQAEELLGSGIATSGEDFQQLAVQPIAKIFDGCPDVRILVSLRNEYYLSLGRALDGTVSNMVQRTMFVQRFNGDDIRKAVRRTIASTDRICNIDVDDLALELLLKWLALPRSSCSSHRLSDTFYHHKPLRLIEVQATLLWLYEHVLASEEYESWQPSVRRKFTIDERVLRLFMRGAESDEAAKPREAIKEEELAQEALEEHIERALEGVTDCWDKCSHEDGPNELAVRMKHWLPDVGRNEADGLVRRNVAFMSRLLSLPGSFKVPLDEEDLIADSLMEDLRGVGAGREVRGLLKKMVSLVRNEDPILGSEYPHHKYPAIFGSIPLSEILNDTAGSPRFESEWLSGWSRRQEYEKDDPASTKKLARSLQMRLVASALVGIDALEAGNILKPSAGEGRRSWQLVHDGFSSVFREWGDEVLSSVEGTTASICAHRGRSLSWKRVDAYLDPDRWFDLPRYMRRRAYLSRSSAQDDRLVLSHQTWLGCFVSAPQSGQLEDANTVFTGVDFVDCNFKGTVFDNCHFIDCSFVDCTFDGVVFRRSRFTDTTLRSRNNGERSSVLFSAISIAFIEHCWEGNCAIQNGIMEGASFIRCSVDGLLRVESMNLRFAQIFPLRSATGEGVMKLGTGCNLGNSLFSDWVTPQDAMVTIQDPCRDKDPAKRINIVPK